MQEKEENQNLEDPCGEVLEEYDESRKGFCDCLCIPVHWFRMLSREMHWSFVFGVIVIYGVSQGLGGALSSVGTKYYMKDIQKVQPSEAQVYAGITYIPWIVKPLWGLLTDVLPIFGYRRRPYFILAGFIGVIGMLLLSLHENLHLVLALLSLTVGSAGVAIADVTIDACVAQNSISHPSLAADMQSLCAFSSSVGALLGFSISGIFVHLMGPMKNGSFPSVYDDASTMEWTKSMQSCFVDLMIEQVNRGNRNGYLFSEQAWTDMTQAFSAKLGVQFDKQFLQDQYFCLMKQHDDITILLSHSGFAWDETLHVIIAENDFWDAYIKDHPDAISYKNRFLYLYQDLCKIFGNKVSDIRVSDLEHLQLMDMNDITFEMDGTSGDFVVISNADTSARDIGNPRGMDMEGSSGNLVVNGNTEISYQDKEKPTEIVMVGSSRNMDVTSNNEVSNQDTERPRETDKDGTSGNLVVTGNAQILSQDKKMPNQMDMNGTCGNLVTSGSNTKISDVNKKRPSTTPLDSRPTKKDMRMKEALSEMASAVKALMNKKEKNSNTLLENALSALQALPDIDEELVMDVCDLLEDERQAKIFLALDASL